MGYFLFDFWLLQKWSYSEFAVLYLFGSISGLIIRFKRPKSGLASYIDHRSTTDIYSKHKKF
jgi:hypothetical protein